MRTCSKSSTSMARDLCSRLAICCCTRTHKPSEHGCGAVSVGHLLEALCQTLTMFEFELERLPRAACVQRWRPPDGCEQSVSGVQDMYCRWYALNGLR
jgi:hypothetical protein